MNVVGNNKVVKITTFTILAIASSIVLATTNSNVSVVAQTVTTQASAIAKLLSITAYVAGVGFALGGILQFKVHKENPQQTPLSKPVVMIIVAACLLFLPTVMEIAGNSLFGTTATSSATAGGGRVLTGH